ncbi:DNA mismatch repair protein MutS [Flavihumibacter sp. ZG627]|uniref:DNA mismatch repair protein MutS n=1 Tax=Flavihumibacter sp. ZG627 TaxID=1463156 RepID=UPI00057C4496|nr:DNA mismatch repair protein MutS [Flavihumibacter sp. ZG627]KIC91557.1 DNA mismatch repair protein MutS [Flavihumibacter sp. ZG627]
MSKSSADTPLMQQHRAIKQRYPDAILLFRVGDFYETFGQDAIIASQVLGITLTKRNNGSASASELAGFPHHSVETYLHKLVKAGYRVAICDQLEDPKLAKGIVKRGVTEMVTPGTATSDKLLDHHSNNFLASLYFVSDDLFGIAFLDISTGEFFIAEGDREYADKMLQSFQPAEVLFQRQRQKLFKEYFGPRFYTYSLDEWIFQNSYAKDILLKHFQTHSLKGFGVESLSNGLIAAGAIMHYLKDTEHPNLQHITSMQRIDRDDFLWMDRFTVRNLELLGTPGTESHSLLRVMDQTVSAMGARLLKRWIVFPLKDIKPINERLDLVEFFITSVDMRNQLSQHIRQAGDIERLVSKITLKKIGPREVLQLAKGLEQVAAIKLLCGGASNDYLARLSDALNPCVYIAGKIHAELVENAPPTTAKGSFIASGINKELDDLRAIASTGKEYLVQMQQKESVNTGIPSLKIGFNNVFGYYLEVTNTHKHKVPAEWTRKQTLANAERYITPELKEYEEKITGAEDKIMRIELELFESLLNELQDYLQPIQANGNILAILDCLVCFANIALQFRYKRPQMHEGGDLTIKAGRHPVIERFLGAGDQYVSNDIELNKSEQQVIILTGPNMSGKSALLRQVAIITLMAHMGSFVPADEAQVPITDKIFTRVGASDNLSGGESTFMVEMNETASILNNVTSRSLILLDEIGRGTSTYDGISIAWSIVEYLHQTVHAPLTLFATHYHELNELENKWERVKNFHITNKEVGNKIIFLRKLAPGGSTHSFGIHVARMAGMPGTLISRANEILEQLESKHLGAGNDISDYDNCAGSPRIEDLGHKVKELGGPKIQLSIFDVHSQTFDQIRKVLEGLDINRLTPVEALLKLQEIKNMIN